MRYLFLLSIMLIVSISCRKSNDDVSGSEEITGKLYLHNPYDSFPPALQSNQMVLLQRSTDLTPSSFLFSTSTNATGNFGFQFLYSDIFYKVHAETRTNTRLDKDILFVADSMLKASKNLAITMRPDTFKQNGLFIICQDTAVVTGTMPRDSIYIYLSSVLAAADSTAINGSGASYSFVSNMDGRALKMNLPYSGPLYINSTCTYSGKKYKSTYDIKQLRKTGIDTVWLKLGLQ